MTLSELQQKGAQMLSAAGTDNSANEARWLLESDSGLTGAQLILRADENVSAEDEEKYLSHIFERISGRPLQYIIGSWQFYGRDFLVGEGVLIPRPETELLCDAALDFIKDISSPAVIDLCAGSGCIGLTIAKERPDSSVLLVEKYNDALSWLRKNKEYLGAENAAILQADILKTGELILPRADLIVTNPPYIPSAEIPGLQSEVHYEPSTALDGGEDGLDFYRAVKDISLKLGRCPVIAECGENQTDGLKAIFGKVRMIKDFASIERIMVYSGETNDI
ncbi:MAG: peptide chain release factor N(5)-glutamine methyltransferase [Clostridia bacterium]|nr:peptide chain release factor N(5)-glutamine methyltransferase [Clostridia bacterium]